MDNYVSFDLTFRCHDFYYIDYININLNLNLTRVESKFHKLSCTLIYKRPHDKSKCYNLFALALNIVARIFGKKWEESKSFLLSLVPWTSSLVKSYNLLQGMEFIEKKEAILIYFFLPFKISLKRKWKKLLKMFFHAWSLIIKCGQEQSKTLEITNAYLT